MDPKSIPTSFIPKETLVAKTSKPRGSISLFTVLGFLIFFLSLVAWGGAFFYHQYLVEDVNTLSASLKRVEEDVFARNVLEDYINLDRKIQLANTLITNHNTLVPLFALLEEKTLRTVRFKNFQFLTNTAGQGELRIKMSGEARDYAAVALQADSFGAEGEWIINPIFSNLNLDPAGNVLFDVTFTINPYLLSYSRTQGVTKQQQ